MTEEEMHPVWRQWFNDRQKCPKCPMMHVWSDIDVYELTETGATTVDLPQRLFRVRRCGHIITDTEARPVKTNFRWEFNL